MAETRVPMTRALGMGALPTFVEEGAGLRQLQRLFERQHLPFSLIDNREMRLPFAAMQQLFDDAAHVVSHTFVINRVIAAEMAARDSRE